MGFAPPEDAPSPEEQAAVDASAGFEPSPTGTTLCDFGFPTFNFNFGFRLPSINFDFPPQLSFTIALNCDLSDPLDAQVSFGGGRTSGVDPSTEEEAEKL